MPSHAIRPGAHAAFTFPASHQPGRHRALRAPGPLIRKFLALAARLGRTVTVLAMLLLTSAVLLLAANAPDSGDAGSVPAASYGD